MTCPICEKAFGPGKFSPRQKYCGGECREKARALYKRQYDQAWRSRHPSYMSCYCREYRKQY